MSRIGKAPVYFDDKVTVELTSANEIIVKGPKHIQRVKMKPEITAEVEDQRITFVRNSNDIESRSLHGLYRSLVQNAVLGVSQGYSKTLELIGVGYRAQVVGKKLELNLGYSHPVQYLIPDDIEIKIEKQTTITVIGPDKGLVGQVAAKIRSFRAPEPYLGKGVKYADEKIRRKAGKAAGK